jgi:hypothetical protein
VAGDLSVQPAKYNGNPRRREGQVEDQTQSEDATEHKTNSRVCGEIRLILAARPPTLSAGSAMEICRAKNADKKYECHC